LIGATLGTISRVSILQFTPAGLVLEFDTPFHAAVRNLKSPTSASFDAAEWLAAYDQLKDPQRLDTSLLVAAVWIAAESMALRDLPKDPDFEALDAATTVMLAVATMNREYLTAEELSGESIKAAHEKGAVSFGHILLRPLREASTRQSISADDAIQAAVDAGESWIFDGYRKAGGTARDDLDLARVAARAMRRYSIQRGLNDLWNQSYWEGWRLTNLGDKFTWAPSNRSLATRLRAGLIRQSENFMNYPFIDMAAWVAMDPEARRAARFHGRLWAYRQGIAGRSALADPHVGHGNRRRFSSSVGASKEAIWNSYWTARFRTRSGSPADGWYKLGT
jgi:hypothetical protein